MGRRAVVAPRTSARTTRSARPRRTDRPAAGTAAESAPTRRRARTAPPSRPPRSRARPARRTGRRTPGHYNWSMEAAAIDWITETLLAALHRGDAVDATALSFLLRRYRDSDRDD